MEASQFCNSSGQPGTTIPYSLFPIPYSAVPCSLFPVPFIRDKPVSIPLTQGKKPGQKRQCHKNQISQKNYSVSGSIFNSRSFAANFSTFCSANSCFCSANFCFCSANFCFSANKVASFRVGTISHAGVK